MMMTESYVNIADQVCSRSDSEVVLPVRVENLLVKIYEQHTHPPVNVDTRRRLSSISEELALEILSKVFNASIVKSTLDAFIIFFLKGSPPRVSGEYPVQSPRTPGKKSRRGFQAEKSLDFEAPSTLKVLKREGNGGYPHSPQLLALGELEFNKAFLLLSYTAGKPLAEVVSADQIREWKDLPMAAYETAVWFRFGKDYCHQKERRVKYREIAGGDFDGDMYFISRNPELLKHFKPSEPWVSSSPPSKIYTSTKPSELPPEVLEELLFKMFLKARFDSSSVVGTAADSWLAIMDGYLTLGDARPKEKAERKKKMQKAIDVYYDALDAPKKGAKVNLPLDLKLNIFPRYMEGKKNFKTFKSTSILGIMYDTVVSQSADELPSPEISKLRCFKDESVPEFYMEKCRRWYDNYRDEMSRAMNTNEKEAANEVIKRYKQEFYGADRFEDSKRTLEELYQQALALYCWGNRTTNNTNGAAELEVFPRTCVNL